MTIFEYAHNKQDNDYSQYGYKSEDIKKIINLCTANNIDMTPKLALHLWQHVSDEWDAVWLVLPDNDIELMDMLCKSALEIERR